MHLVASSLETGGLEAPGRGGGLLILQLADTCKQTGLQRGTIGCILNCPLHRNRTIFCSMRDHSAQLMHKREKSFGIQMLSVQPDTKPKGCAGCNRKIKDRYLLKALDKYWHEDCLKCACCDCRLGEVGSTLYTKANLILCRRDYLRLFGVTGNCAACSKLIPAFEMVMRAKDNVYHLDCFACQLCNQRFCVGDKFFLKNNMILCQTDYEEGLMKEGYTAQVR
ncbi:LIM domain only 3 isoform X1 [Pelobates cultripes]|uniref:LIM domain only protein 3 n=3 Tax=Anura TaxID=8342 RepID=A0AAD1RUL4_PELCU|nr:LIM domain only 3 isoform X1 [Pelobates cultripes]